MDNSLKNILSLLRISLGGVFIYAGITKILNTEWSAAGYLENAKSFTDFYAWLASPEHIEIVNILNEWGLLLIGIGLLFGIATKYASIAGIILMLLYYFPILDFPYVGDHSFLVDDHIIYALLLVLIIKTKAGKFNSLSSLKFSNN